MILYWKNYIFNITLNYFFAIFIVFYNAERLSII